jgi:hypothetical protein
MKYADRLSSTRALSSRYDPTVADSAARCAESGKGWVGPPSLVAELRAANGSASKGGGRGTWKPGPVVPGGDRVCWRACFESALFETTAFSGPILGLHLPSYTHGEAFSSPRAHRLTSKKQCGWRLSVGSIASPALSSDVAGLFASVVVRSGRLADPVHGASR